MSKSLTTIVGTVVLVMLIAFSIPYALDHSQNDLVETDQFQSAESTELINESLLVRVDSIGTNQSTNNVTVTVQDLQTLNASTRTINESQKEIFQMDGGNVSMTPTSVATNDAVFRFEYPPTYGWDDSQKRLAGFVPILLVGVAVIILGSLITSAVNRI